MNEQELITNLSNYLEMLISENTVGLPLHSKSREMQFLQNVERNMKDIFIETAKHDNIGKILRCYVRDSSELTHISDRLWNFTVLSLTLLKGLKEALSSQTNQSREPDTSKGHLHINQQNTIKKCLQYIVALGILPNIIPSVRTVLKNKSDASHGFETFDTRSTVQQKYYRLLTTLSVLLECLAQETLAEVILGQHSGEILAALLQLCYAPIKKLDTFQNETGDSQEREMETNQMEKYEDFNWYIFKLRACNGYTDKDFIAEMWEDRKYFQGCLAKFLKKITLSEHMWQLLRLQGSSIGSTVEKPDDKFKAPPWLLKICNQMLTEKFFDEACLRTFIQMVAETMTVVDGDSKRFSQEKINAIARIISHNPARHISLEMYMREISPQVKSLLRNKDLGPTKIFPLVASSIVLNLAQRNFDLSESVVSRTLFASFWSCLQNEGKLLMDGDVIVSEEPLTICIDDAYEVFVYNHPVLSDEALMLLMPFYHLLYVMFVKLVNGVSFLKSKVCDLLVVILNRATSDDALKLLKAATFEDVVVPKLVLATNLKCIYGDNGGIAVVRHSDQCEDFEEEINQKCQAITRLLSRVTDKKVKTSFFLEIVKRTVHLERNDPDYVEKKDVKMLINVLIAVRLMEELADSVCEDLINNIEETVGVIKVALESINAKKQEDDDTFSDQTVLAFLLILSTLVGYKDQLKSSHWNALKECLTPLRVLSENTTNVLVKEMVDRVFDTIQLQGTVLLTSEKPPSEEKKEDCHRIQEVLQDRNQPKKLIEDITNIATISNPSGDHKDKKERLSAYHQAIFEAENDAEIPVRSHGLVWLRQLLESKDTETLLHKQAVLQIFQKNITDEDSYVYLPAIMGLSSLGDIDVEMVLPVLLSEFISCKPEKWKATLKCGEALMRICRKLGDLTPKYKDQFLNTYLTGVRHQDPQIRASSLSNLGEVCKMLRFSIGPMLQEIILCVTSILKTDSAIEVRRAAILVIVLLLRGTGRDTFSILGNELKDLRAILKRAYISEKDDVLRLHAQEGLVELDSMVKETLEFKAPLVKEIRIL